MNTIFKSCLKLILIGFFLSMLGCMGATANSLSSAGSASGSAGGGSSSGDSASFEAGEPIDIPVPVAKSIKPINATTVQARVTSDQVSVTAQADPFQTIQIYDKNSTLIQETITDNKGLFTITASTETYSLGDPLLMVVFFESSVSTPVVVRLFDDNYFTVAVTNQYNIPLKDLVLNPACGVAFNATSSEGANGLLCISSNGEEVAVLNETLGSSLDQLQFCQNNSFFVGLNSSNQIVRVNLSDDSETVISDSAIDGASIRLSPNCQNVVATITTANDTELVLVEPTTAQAADRITVNSQSTIGRYHECDWVADSILQCIHEDRDGTYDMGLFNLYSALQNNTLNPELNFIGVTTSVATEMRNLRMDPNTQNRYTFEAINSENLVSLLIGNYETDSTLVDGLLGHTDLTNSRWALDGSQVMFDMAFGDLSIVGFYTLSTGEKILATLGSKPIPADTDNPNLVAYLCEDYLGNNQVCILNQANLNF